MMHRLKNLCVVCIKGDYNFIHYNHLSRRARAQMSCNCIALVLKLANTWFISVQGIEQQHRIKQRILGGNAVPLSGFSNGILLYSYGNFSDDLFRSMLRPPIPRLCD